MNPRWKVSRCEASPLQLRSQRERFHLDGLSGNFGASPACAGGNINSLSEARETNVIATASGFRNDFDKSGHRKMPGADGRLEPVTLHPSLFRQSAARRVGPRGFLHPLRKLNHRWRSASTPWLEGDYVELRRHEGLRSARTSSLCQIKPVARQLLRF